MIRAAGVLLVTEDDKVLLLRRAGDDHAGEWALPGGRIEDGETPEQAARRETQEETGHEFRGELHPWTRRLRDGVDYQTFAARTEPFKAALNEEHDKAVWIDPETALEELKLHPGVRVVLQRPRMNELDVAKAMRDGELTSPQRFANVLLVKMRVTGTGQAYRNKIDEHVWRDPSFYMNEEFRQRCYGLPVIWDHPTNKAQMLDSHEFAKRIVGTSFLPYLVDEPQEDAGDEHGDEPPAPDGRRQEVWTIAKLWDDAAQKAAEHDVCSTSPCIVFTDEDLGKKVKDGDSHWLFEGPPSFADHLALLVTPKAETKDPHLGVWDRGEPKGVESVTASADSAEPIANPIDEALARLRDSEITSILRRIAA